MKRLGVAALFAAGALLLGGAPAGGAARQFVLSPEGNHLWAYDTVTKQRQLVVRARNGGDPGANAPNGIVRDINGQICVSPDGGHVITGEDTVTGEGSSHDPRIAGWGWFSIAGDAIGAITVEQIGKLAPEAGGGPGYAGDPDNYGCGFLDANRLFTTAIGNTLPGEEANGQLFLWFGPFEQATVAHCEIDRTLATAGGVTVAPNGDVYVATNRPTQIPGGDPSAIWRFSGTWPRSAAECTPAFLAANITKTRVLPSAPALPADPLAPTPSAVIITPSNTMLVSSVFSGTVSEFTREGQWIRDVYPLSPVALRTGPTGNTPYGMVIAGDELWIADLGIVAAAPAPGQGSLIVVQLNAQATPATTVQSNLTFPDGLGLYTGRPAAPAAPLPAAQVAGKTETLPATGRDAPLAIAAMFVVAAIILRRAR